MVDEEDDALRITDYQRMLSLVRSIERTPLEEKLRLRRFEQLWVDKRARLPSPVVDQMVRLPADESLAYGRCFGNRAGAYNHREVVIEDGAIDLLSLAAGHLLDSFAGEFLLVELSGQGVAPVMRLPAALVRKSWLDLLIADRNAICIFDEAVQMGIRLDIDAPPGFVFESENVLALQEGGAEFALRAWGDWVNPVRRSIRS